MKDKVVLYKKIPEQQQLLLSQLFNLTCFDKVDESNLKQFIHEIKDAIGLIGAGVKLTQDILQHAPNLKVISTISVGYDHFDLDYLKSRNIALMHTQVLSFIQSLCSNTYFCLCQPCCRDCLLDDSFRNRYLLVSVFQLLP